LPDLRGRVSVGVGNSYTLGSVFGEEATTLMPSQLPPHVHALPGGVTGIIGGGIPVNNVQPSLALHYLIALQGIFPSRDPGGSSFDPNVPILGQIVEFAGNYAPGGWAFAHGQLLPINQNQALFSLLGTTYGGDGRVNFGLPNLDGRTPMHMGNGHTLGERGGEQGHTLSISEIPTHAHTANATSDPHSTSPENYQAVASDTLFAVVANLYTNPANLTPLLPATLSNLGGSQPHENMQPYLTLNFSIALQGIFPSQN